MFERRLKVFLGVLVFFTAVLVLRAAHVQVVQHARWDDWAAKSATRTERQETTRGEIRDYWRRKVAVDKPCVDAAVDYRALTAEPNEKWVKELARTRLKARLGDDFAATPRQRREALVDAEMKQIRDDVAQMWPRLAKIANRPLEEVEETRRQIVEKVKMRRRFVWYRNYEKALNNHKEDAAAAQTQPASVWKKWLLDDDQDVPDVDNFALSVSEESAPHVVLRDIDPQVRAELSAYSERFPGLSLKFGTHRVYPYGDAAAHVIGRMSKVLPQDLKDDPNPGDELRMYEPNDLIGRGGVEAMCERLLRGSRGRREVVDRHVVSTQEAVPGKDVQISIDIELQTEIQALFKAVVVKSKDADNNDVEDTIAMHGAAVVIDVPTGEVLALVSAPSYDLNLYDEQYAELNSPANLDMPLLNRATQAQREPGSTVKPMVGLAAAATGVRGPNDEFECIGYMVVNGHVFPKQGRCWVNSMFHNVLCPDGLNCRRVPCPFVAHHPVPSYAAHPTGRLTLPDALQRSCNPYFETIAHALGPVALSDWYRKFGLGRRTYIGIPEAKGRVPVSKDDDQPVHAANAMLSTWTAGIGQGPVQATPIQMANVAATLARNGVWVRPRLLRPESAAAYGPATRPSEGPDRVDLGLPPEALAAVKEGMIRVVNTRAGSGGAAQRTDMIVAGKTGSATAAPAFKKEIDPVTGREVRDEHGKIQYAKLSPSSHWDPNPLAPWYRDTGKEGSKDPTLTHSWFMGYAPADKPQVAFAVLVEYGGGGGAAAGSVAKELLKLCVTHGHLKLPDKTPVAASAAPATEELLHDARR